MPCVTYECQHGARTIGVVRDRDDAEVPCPRCGKPMHAKRKDHSKPFNGVPTVIGGDVSFMRNFGSDDGFGKDERSRRIALRKARAAGVSTAGKKFVPDLVPHRQPFHPFGWVADTNEVIAKCKNRNLDCEGLVNHKAYIVDKPSPDEVPYHVDPALVEKDVQRVNREVFGGRMSDNEKKHLREDLATRYDGNGLD